jgi:hypothetical protein
MKELVPRLIHEEEGQDLVEYALACVYSLGRHCCTTGSWERSKQRIQPIG